jgi:broad specificity phosphatase PhoE
MAAGRLYLIRHGKPASTWGDHGADPDPGLDELGRRQAEAAAQALLALPEALRPTRVLTSPLQRCRDTAAPFAAVLGVEAIVEPAVAEIPTPAGLEGAARSTWLRQAFDLTWNEVEGGDYAAWRVGVAQALLKAAPAAVFSHFVAINAAVSFAEGHDRVRACQPGHASITVLEADGEGGLKLIELGAQAETQVL